MLMKLNILPPRDAANLRTAADRARDRRQWGDAARLYRSYLEEKPGDFEIWVQCGHSEKESGDFDAALQCYLAAQALRGNDADLHLQLGHLYKLMGREAEAIAAYRKCLEFDRDSADATRELAAFMRPVEAPVHGQLAEPQAPALSPPAFEFPFDTLTSDSALRQRIAREQANGDLVSVAILTRALLRLAPRDSARWLALAEALERIGAEDQASRCRAVAAAADSGTAARRRN